MTPDAQARALAEELVRKYNYAVRVTPQAEHGHRLIALVMDALLAARPTWTDERPTEPGWYWWKEKSGTMVNLAHISDWYGDGTLFVGREQFLMQKLEHCGGQWARIEMPEEKSW